MPTAKKPKTKEKSKTVSKSKTKKTTKSKSTESAPKKKTSKGATKNTKKKSDNNSRVLICANGEECFWTTDGRILKDLTELRDALKEMTEEVFAAHVTKEKNDFAEWVEHVLEDAACAEALRRSKKPNTARTVVVRHLKLYSV